MGVDANLLREEKDGNPEAVRQSEKRRGRSGAAVDVFIEKDVEWRKKLFTMEHLKKELNTVSKEIGQRKSKGNTEGCDDLVAKSLAIKKEIAEAEAQVTGLAGERDEILRSIGNVVHPSVVTSNDETENAVIRDWWPDGMDVDLVKAMEMDGTAGRLHHHEVMACLDGFDPKKGSEIAGHRGYFLKGSCVKFNLALQSYGMSFLETNGYMPIQPPYLMRRNVMACTAELKDFEDTLYRVPMGGDAKDPEKDDFFLIATSEQPISALHRNEFLEEKELPKRYAGVSTCFRKEAGSSGKDMWGIFRVHQFEKIEQFVVTTPEEAEKEHEAMIELSEKFYQSLELPYRIVTIVSGALNDAASKKYDLEAWFPGYRDHRELVSCSNCTDYQSRALEIRVGGPKMGDRQKRYAHMLNGTLVATQRTLCCILENYQTEEGVRVPAALQPYMGGETFLPFKSPPSKRG